MEYGELLTFKIDAAFKHQEEQLDDGHRTHLGASVIGRKCLRQIWFSFRWAGREQLDGRKYRLFSRGDWEEHRFEQLIKILGAQVWTVDPATGKQIRVSAHGGHFGGSLDGVAVGLPDLPYGIDPNAPILLEFKTHNDKSFSELVKKGLDKSKPTHVAQAQSYMHLSGIQWCLYLGVNKNDDHLHLHLFPYEASKGTHLINRADSVIFGTGLPPRISSDPTWFECRFCNFKALCFGQESPARNCRTCRHLVAQRDGSWLCQKYMALRTTSEQKLGCESFEVMPELEQQ